MYHPQPKCCLENGDHWTFYWDVLGVSGVHTDAGYIFRSQHPMAFDRHEEKPDQNSSHRTAQERSVTERAASGREPKRKSGGSGVCVCVCVWERWIKSRWKYNIWTLKGKDLNPEKNFSSWNHRHIFFSSISKNFINKRVWKYRWSITQLHKKKIFYTLQAS